MGDVPETAYDKTIRKLKNNKFIVILLLLFVCFTALVKLLDGWQTIGSVFVQNDDLDTSIVTEQPVVTPIDTVLEPINPPATVVVDSPSSPEVISNNSLPLHPTNSIHYQLLLPLQRHRCLSKVNLKVTLIAPSPYMLDRMRSF